MDTKIITAQTIPLNNRELDTPMFVFDKMKSVINSCKTLEQIDNCRNLHIIYNLRFPEHKDIGYRLMLWYNTRHHWFLTKNLQEALASIRRYSPAEIAMQIDNDDIQSNNQGSEQ